MIVVKKYSNRRLYDTDESRYITLEELTDKIRHGADVQVIDAKTNDDLTQATLTQIILESPAAKFLPRELLARLIRMPDDALSEFFGRYVASALELYLMARQGADNVAPYFPFANVPFAASNALARLVNGANLWGSPPAAPPAPPRSPSTGPSDIESLRSEFEDLKRELRKKRR